MDLITKYNESLKKHYNENIKARAGCGLPLTAQERAKYILFLATTQQAINFINREVKNDGRN